MRFPLMGLLAVVLCLFHFTSGDVEASWFSRKETVLTKTPFTFLKFHQVAKLEKVQRVRYIRALRQAIADAEAGQTLFKNPLIASRDLRNHNKIYALLLGIEAWAAPQFAGGHLSTDQCIYAYKLSKYPESGKRQRGQCIPTIRCESGTSGPGVRCNPFLTGIPESEGRGCIPNFKAYKSTLACEKLRLKMTEEGNNLTSSLNAVTAAEVFFQFNQPNPKLSKDDLEGETAERIIESLLKTAYNDESFAELIKVVASYKVVGLDLPGPTAAECYAKAAQDTSKLLDDGDLVCSMLEILDPSAFENEFNSIEEGVNQIFGAYTAHCSKQVKDSEIEEIRKLIKPTNCEKGKRPRQMGIKLWELERKRCAAVAKWDQLKNAGKPTYDLTVRNVTEIDECRTIETRRDRILTILRDVVGSFPMLAKGPEITPPPEVDLPEEDEWKVDPTGCSGDVTNEHFQLVHSAARCMPCLNERAIVMATRKGIIKDRDRQYQSDSRKWQSLMSNMALACGDGDANNSAVSVDTMRDYNQTFGHCSSDDYEWDPTGNDFTEEDKEFIQFASQNSLWDILQDKQEKILNLEDIESEKVRKFIERKVLPRLNAGKPRKIQRSRLRKFFEQKFEDVYGIQYGQATNVFCHPQRIKKRFWGRNVKKFNRSVTPKYKKGSKKDQPYTKKELLVQGRHRMNKYLSTKRSQNRLEPALHKCMQNAFETAKKIYSGSENFCTSSRPMKNLNRGEYNRMLNHIVDDGGAALIYDNGLCHVSRQVESNSFPGQLDKEGREGPRITKQLISFTGPAQQSQSQSSGPDHYQLVRKMPGLDADKADFVPQHFLVTKNTARDVLKLPNEEDDSNLRYTLPDTNACNVGKYDYLDRKKGKGRSR